MTTLPKLTDLQKRTLAQVCRTNGGGVSVRCKVDADGVVVPVNRAFAKLFALGLIQGKAGGYEKVVHTRDGLAVHRHLLEDAAP